MKFALQIPQILRSTLKILFTGMLVGGIHSIDLALAASEKNHEVKHTFKYDHSDLSIEQKGEYDVISLAGATTPEDEAGTPSLPAVYANILVPAGSSVQGVTAVAKKEILVAEGLLIYPSQPPLPKVEGIKPEFVKPKAAAYQKTSKKELSTNGKPQTVRGMTIVSVRLNPVRVVPSSGDLYLAQEIEVTISVNKPAQRLSIEQGKHFDEFISGVKKSVVNPEEPEGMPLAKGGNGGDTTSTTGSGADTSDTTSTTMSTTEEPMATTGADCDYLVITSNALLPNFQTLASHRTSMKGLTTEVISVETIYATYSGKDNQTKIRNCIKDYVANHGTSYVALGGDSTVVPARLCKVVCGTYVLTAPTDLYYAGLDGTWDEDGDGVYGEANTTAGDEGDLLADVWVGRIPVQTATHANAYINKLMNYELNPPLSITRKYMTGGCELWNTYTTSARPTDSVNDGLAQFSASNHPKVSDAEVWMRRAYREVVQPSGWVPSQYGTMFDTITSWDSSICGDYSGSNVNMVTRLNEGWNFVMTDTHGQTVKIGTEGSYFTTSNAASLTGLTTIFYTGACFSGGFDTGEPSLSEAMLRNPNGGAIVYFGCSRYNWGSSVSVDGGTATQYLRKFMDIVFRGQVKNTAKAFYDHKAAFISLSLTDGSKRWDNLAINYQGDPAFAIMGAELSTSTSNIAPVATNDSYSTPTGVALSVTAASGVLKNDSDANGNALTATVVTLPTHGTLSLSSTGSFTYTPAAGYAGADSFTYKAKDAALFSNIATVSITVTASVNRVPVAVGNSYSVNQGAVLTAAAPGVLGNDTDADGDALTASLATNPAHGTLSLSSNGSFTYTPAAGYSGSDSFTYKASDGKSTSSTATVGINVTSTSSGTDNVVTLSRPDGVCSEPGTDTGSFKISRTGSLSAALTVNYVMSGSASNGSDYQTLSGSVAIAAGASSATLMVTPINDLNIEGFESVTLTLSASTAYQLGSAKSATVKLYDDELPVVNLGLSDNSISETGPNNGVFTITRSGNTSASLTVKYAIAGTAGNGIDYSALSGSVTIAAGSTSAVVVVAPVNDTLIEGSETVKISISSNAAYQIGLHGAITVSLVDND
jgi:VCBS repeat-containing protein